MSDRNRPDTKNAAAMTRIASVIHILKYIINAAASNIRRSRVQSKCFCYAEAQQYKWRDSVKYTKKFAFPGEMLTFA